MGTVSGTPLIVDLVGRPAVQRVCDRLDQAQQQLQHALEPFVDAFDDVMIAYARLADLLAQAQRAGLADPEDRIGPPGDEFAGYRAAMRTIHKARADLTTVRNELAETDLGAQNGKVPLASILHEVAADLSNHG